MRGLWAAAAVIGIVSTGLITASAWVSSSTTLSDRLGITGVIVLFAGGFAIFAWTEYGGRR